MLAHIGPAQRDEISAASLIRPWRTDESEMKWPVVIKAPEEDPSFLVRGAAAAYNRGVLLIEDQAEEGLNWSRKPFPLRPNERDYA